MAATFTKIATVTVGSGGTTAIEFTSISASYTDLCLYLSLKSDRASQYYSNAKIQFNGSTTSYSMKVLYGQGSTAGSFSDTDIYDYNNATSSTASTFSNTMVYVPNYGSSNYKSVSLDVAVEINSSTNNTLDLSAGLWSNTGAITSIKILDYYSTSTKFVEFSSATLYGIKNS